MFYLVIALLVAITSAVIMVRVRRFRWGLIALVVLIGAALALQVTVANDVYRFLRMGVAPLAVVSGSVVVAALVWRSREAGGPSAGAPKARLRRRGQPVARPSFSVPFSALVLIGVGMVGALALLVLGKWRADVVYARSISVSTAPAPTYDSRAPYVVAQALAPTAVRTNGDLDIASTTYLPAQQRYTSLVNRRSVFGGYTEVIDQAVTADGHVNTQNCQVGKSAASLGGSLNHNLDRRIIREHPGVGLNRDDAYGFCDAGVAKVVMPLTRLSGLWPVTSVPAGVAIYDTKSEAIEHVVEGAGGVPGPMYPLSLAEVQRDASLATGSFFDWVFNRVGYSTTTVDPQDPNAENAGEFTLARRGEDGADFVTPLTRRGRGTAIVAVSTLDAGQARVGSLAQLSVHTLPAPREANSTVEQAMKAKLTKVPWATPGFGVFEIVPTGPDSWIASLGMRQNVVYHVDLTADGAMRLLNAGDGSAAQIITAQGTTEVPGDATTVPSPGADLSRLTDQELAELQARVSAEVSKRLQ